MIRLPSLLSLLLALVFAAGSAAAVEPDSGWASTGQTKLRLISAATAVGSGNVPLGLDIVIIPKWKTYWRSPGDAGLPVTIDWTGSTNLASATISWPVPQRFT